MAPGSTQITVRISPDEAWVELVGDEEMEPTAAAQVARLLTIAARAAADANDELHPPLPPQPSTSTSATDLAVKWVEATKPRRRWWQR